MDELIAKLTNLSYDFFGILLPGVIFNIFVILLWFGLGSLVPFLTLNSIPEFTLMTLPDWTSALSHNGGILAGFLMLFLWYFMGHLLNWFGRAGKSMQDKIPEHIRILKSLIFRIPKPQYPFSQKLNSLYNVIENEFSPIGVKVEWGALFPVLRTYLAQNFSRSLVTTYQNKYTLHRSITTASTFLFWGSLLGIFGGVAMTYFYCIQPHFAFLILLATASLILVWGFSGSYLYNWTLFGNSIVSETYSLLHVAKNDISSK